MPNKAYFGQPLKPKAGQVPGDPVRHRVRRVQRAPGGRPRQPPEDRRRLPASRRRAARSRRTRPSAPTRSAATPSTRCTRGASTTSRSTSSPRRGTGRSSGSCTSAQALAYLMNQAGGHLRPAARLRQVHGRPGRDLPGHPVPVRRRAGRGDPFPYNPAKAGATAAPATAGRSLPNGSTTCEQPFAVRRWCQAGAGAELHPAVRERDRLDCVGNDPAPVERPRHDRLSNSTWSPSRSTR